MPSENIEKCPHCGQSINKREIPLTDALIRPLMRVAIWSKQHGKHEFKRKDIKHLLKTDTEVANFGYLAWFGLLYHPDGKRGLWGINHQHVEDFLKGRKQINSLIIKHPLQEQLQHLKPVYVWEVPSIKQFLDENNEYIAKYYSDGQAPLL